MLCKMVLSQGGQAGVSLRQILLTDKDEWVEPWV